MQSIEGFFGHWRFLSNFHLCEILYEGVVYPSVENAYMAAKTTDLDERKQFEKCTPAVAKQKGRKVKLRENWDEMRIDIMRQLINYKFDIPELKEKLLSTKNCYLEETNTWKDTFWGVCEGVGENNLGKLLMEKRDGYSNNL